MQVTIIGINYTIINFSIKLYKYFYITYQSFRIEQPVSPLKFEVTNTCFDDELWPRSSDGLGLSSLLARVRLPSAAMHSRRSSTPPPNSGRPLAEAHPPC